MADVWYYAQNGQQAGPVSASQLQQLARSGQIQATDLVWKEGLPQWVQAKAIKGLFAAQAEPVPVAPVAPADRPARRDYADDRDDDRRARRREPDYEDDDRPRRRPRDDFDDAADDRPRRRARADDEGAADDEDRPRRRRRKAAGGWEGLPTGAKVGILVGGLVLVVAAVAIPVIIFMSGGGGGLGANSWTTPALRPGQTHDKSWNFNAGDEVEIIAKGNRGRMGDPAFDVDLHVLGPNGMPVAGDPSIGPDSRVNFRAQVTGAYTVRILNVSLQGNNAISSTVTVKVTKAANPPPGANNKDKVPPPGNKDGIAKKDGQPPFGGGGGIDDGNKTWPDRLLATDAFDRVRNQCKHKAYFYRMKAGTHYTIRMVANDQRFDPYLRLENPAGVEVASDDDGDAPGTLNARIEYDCPQDGVYRIIATSFQPSLGPYTLTVTPGQK